MRVRMNSIDAKYEHLKELLQTYGKTAVAFSGGVDSTFLLKACVDTLGAKNVLACIGQPLFGPTPTHASP